MLNVLIIQFIVVYLHLEINQINKSNMNILSLCDGIRCGRIALDRAGIKVDKYYSSEIDKYANQVGRIHYPDAIELGDMTNWGNWNIDWANIDLVIGGTPCQSFSIAGNQKGFNGKSGLFFEFADIYHNVLLHNPNALFLLENVVMKKEWQNVISKIMGVEPIMIDSTLVSFQNRKRLYWTNISNIQQPVDKKIFFKERYSVNYDDNLILKGKGLNKIQRKRSRVYSIHSDKLPTILKEQESKATDCIVIKHGDIYRYPTLEEAEEMQTIPIGYTSILKYNDAMGVIGNSWTVDVIAHIFKHINQ